MFRCAECHATPQNQPKPHRVVLAYRKIKHSTDRPGLEIETERNLCSPCFDELSPSLRVMEEDVRSTLFLGE